MSQSYRQLASFQHPIAHNLAIAFIPPGWVHHGQTRSRMSTKGRNHHLILDNKPSILQGTRKWPDKRQLIFVTLKIRYIRDLTSSAKRPFITKR